VKRYPNEHYVSALLAQNDIFCSGELQPQISQAHKQSFFT
jgi:hypothetical protein